MPIFIAVTFRNLDFFHIFLVLTVGELCNNSNKYQFFNKSGNKLFINIINLTSVLYLKKLLLLSFAEVYKSIRFWPHFYNFGEWLRCVIYRMYTTFLICKPNISIFTQEAQYPCPSFPKMFGALHRKSF